MTAIQDAYWNALLADATYALNGNASGLSGAEIFEKLKVRMTDPVAQYIADNFTVVTNIDTSDGLSGSGFDATVWKRISDGKIFVSMRGTEPTSSADWLTDAQLALTGNAGAQVVDMVNWWLKVSTNGMAKQVQVIPIVLTGPNGEISTTYELTSAPSVQGLNLVKPEDIANGIEVNGHSLGGYLASAFTRLFGAQAHVTHTTTFNSAGFLPGSELVFAQYASVLGTAYGLGRYPNTDEQTNYFAENGITVTNNTFWFDQIGHHMALFNEKSSGVMTWENHLMYKLTDSLSLVNAIAKLDGGLTFATADAILKAGANTSSASLEKVLDGLVHQLVDANASPTSIGDVGDSATTRSAFQTNLKTLTDKLNTGGSLAGLVGNLHISVASSVLASEAKTEFSALMALQTLSPVVLRGSTVENQALLDGILGGVTANAGLYAQWQADQALSAADRAAGKANITDQWLSDRATLLSLLVQQNLKDSTSSLSATLSGGIATTYLDVTTTQQVITGDGGARRISFGGSGSDSLNGGSGADHLYGNASSDNLWGGGGNDYLEGGDDGDTLYGEAGDDTLIGGAGNDALTSGAGRDVLNGGTGFDAYLISAGESSATIQDSDGSGSIVIEKADLSSYTLGSNIHEIADAPGHYEDAEKNRYLFNGANLIIQLKDGRTITVEGFAGMSGAKLGIDLQAPEAATLPVSPHVYTVSNPGAYMGSLAEQQASGSIETLGYFNSWPSLPEWQSAGAAFGRRETEIINVSEGTDPATGKPFVKVAGGFGDSYITGDDGFNWIYDDEALLPPTGQGAPFGTFHIGDLVGNDYIDGRAGNDFIRTHGGDDVVHGGADSDVIYQTVSGLEQLSDRIVFHPAGDVSWLDAPGHSSNDRLFGDAGNDYIFADGGNQFMDGGDDDDELYAGAGDDVLVGGLGNDTLAGDRYTTAVPVGGSFDANGKILSLSIYKDALFEDLSHYGNDVLDGGSGADKLYGGGGSDTLLGGDGDDELNGDGTEVAGAYQGADYLDGGAGNDRLWGYGGTDTLLGGAGDDVLSGDAGDDYLSGGAGYDALFGGDGNDILEAGVATVGSFGDQLQGGKGDDTYLLTAGMGTVVIDDAEGGNALVLDANMGSISNVSLSSGFLQIVFTGGDQLIMTAATASTMSNGLFSGAAVQNPDGTTESSITAYQADGSSLVYGYDTAIDGSVTQRKEFYDANNQLTEKQVKNPDGSTADSLYDESGRLSSLRAVNVDGSSSQNTYAYEQDGSFALTVNNYDIDQKIINKQLTLSDGSTQIDTYDEMGRPITTDTHDVVTGTTVHGEYTYSSTDQSYTLITQSLPLVGSGTTEEYDYDANQILVRKHVALPNGSTETDIYSATGAPLTIDTYDAAIQETVHSVYAYSSTDQSYTLITQTTPFAGGTTTIAYQYDASHKLVSKQTTMPNGSTVSYAYNSGGQILTSDQHDSLTGSSIHDIYSYNSSNGSYTVTESVLSGSVSTVSVYGYDKYGNLISQASGGAAGTYTESHFDNLGITRSIQLDVNKNRLQDTWDMAIRSANPYGQWFGSDIYNADGSGAGVIASDASWRGSAFSGSVKIAADGSSVAKATNAIGDSITINMDRNGNWLSDTITLADGEVMTDTYGAGYSDTWTYQSPDGDHGFEQYNTGGKLVAWQYVSTGYEEAGTALGNTYTDTTTITDSNAHTITTDTGHFDSTGERIVDTETIRTYDGSGSTLLSDQTIDMVFGTTATKTYAADGSYVEVDTDSDYGVVTTNYNSQGVVTYESIQINGIGTFELNGAVGAVSLTTQGGETALLTVSADGTKNLLVTHSDYSTTETLFQAGPLLRVRETDISADGNFIRTLSNWQPGPFGISYSEVEVTKNAFGSGTSDTIYYSVDWVPSGGGGSHTVTTKTKEVRSFADGSVDTTVYNADGTTREVITHTNYDGGDVLHWSFASDGTQTIDTQPDGSYIISWQDAQGNWAYDRYDAGTRMEYRAEIKGGSHNGGTWWQASTSKYYATGGGIEAFTNTTLMSDNYVAGYAIDDAGAVIGNISTFEVSGLNPFVVLPFEMKYTPTVIPTSGASGSKTTGKPISPGDNFGVPNRSGDSAGGGFGATTIVYPDGSVTVPSGGNFSDADLFTLHQSSAFVPNNILDLTLPNFAMPSSMSAKVVGDPQLVLTLGTTGDSIIINNFDPTDPIQSLSIQKFKFADGATLTLADLFKQLGAGSDGVLNNPDGSVTLYAISPSGDVSYSARTFNADGQLTAYFRLGADNSTERQAWAYNADGSITETQVMTAAGESVTSTFVTTADAAGKLLNRQVTNADGSTEQDAWSYNADGTSTKIQVYTAAGASSSTTYTITTDAMGRWLERDVTNSSDGTMEQDTWDYNADGTTTETQRYVDAAGLQTWYDSTIDATGRMIERDITNPDGSSEQNTWGYNINGSYNLLVTATSASGAINRATYSYDTDDRLVSESFNNADGSFAQYQFNLTGQTTDILAFNADGSFAHSAYVYNPDGSYTLEVFAAAAGAGVVATKTLYQYDASAHLIYERDEAIDGSLMSRYFDDSGTLENQYTQGTDGSYSDTWSNAEAHGAYTWDASALDYTNYWYGSDGSFTSDEVVFASGGSPTNLGSSYYETYSDSQGDQGTRSYDAATNLTTVTWASAAIGSFSETLTGDTGFFGPHNDAGSDGLNSNDSFFNSANNPQFAALLASHSGP